MNKKGFTLIEILVAIGIIGILVGIAAFALQGGQRAGRDAKRKSDLEQIRAGLEYYRQACRTYPASISFGGSLVGTGSGGCTGTFLDKIPQDATSPGRTYSYSYNAGTNSYDICAALEEAPVPPLNMSGFTCGSCGSSGACNYAVSNP